MEDHHPSPNQNIAFESTRSYSHLAEEYDDKRFNTKDGKFLFETDQSIIKKYLAIAKPTNLIDIPVGTGRVLKYLYNYPNLRITGVDATPEMLEKARKVSENMLDTSLIQGSASKLPFVPSEFDCLVSLRFFHLFREEERSQFAREFTRVVKPGGYAIISFTNGWYAGGVNWIKHFLKMRTVYFQYPGELRKLFPDWKIVMFVGNFLPKQYLLNEVPVVGSSIRFATQHFPVNLICWERIYLLQNFKENCNGLNT